MSLHRLLVVPAAALAFAAARCTFAAAPFTPNLPPGLDPSLFRVTTFASNLPFFPTGFLELPDGSYLVAANDPKPAGNSFYTSTGTLLRFTDADHDGIADAAPTPLATGLPGAIVQMKRAGDLLVLNSVIDNAERISVLRLGPTPASPITPVGSLSLSFAPGKEHSSYALATRQLSPTTHELYFNLGSQQNATNTTTTVNATSSTLGAVSWVLNSESIYRARLTDTGSGATLSSPTQIASGLRNAAGIAFAPNGDLYFQDNGIDSPANRGEPLSADELNRIGAVQVAAVLPPPNFGFANDYIQYRTGARIGSGGVQPVIAFQPIPSPNGSESEGAAEITYAPASFPAGLNAGFFVGFHGQFNQAGLANEENPVAYADPATGTYFHFLPNDLPTIGHIDNLYSTNDSLFLIDINSTGSMFTTTPSGAIYQVKALPDVNADGRLSRADLDVLLAHLGQLTSAGIPAGDLNLDGHVSPDDLALMHLYLTNLPSLPTPTPEPALAPLLTLCAIPRRPHRPSATRCA